MAGHHDAVACAIETKRRSGTEIKVAQKFCDVVDPDPDLHGSDKGAVAAADGTRHGKKEIVDGSPFQSAPNVEGLIPVLQLSKPFAIAHVGVWRRVNWCGRHLAAGAIDNEDLARLWKARGKVAKPLPLLLRAEPLDTIPFGQLCDRCEHRVDGCKGPGGMAFGHHRRRRDSGFSFATVAVEVLPRPP